MGDGLAPGPASDADGGTEGGTGGMATPADAEAWEDSPTGDSDTACSLSNTSSFAEAPDSAFASFASRSPHVQAWLSHSVQAAASASVQADQAGLYETAGSVNADKATCAEASESGHVGMAGFDEAADTADADET